MRIFFVCQRALLAPNRRNEITPFNEIRHCARHEVRVFRLADGRQIVRQVD